jgi:prepilin signal peptidase PulO-like enzyme (type II secretory pathway)
MLFYNVILCMIAILITILSSLLEVLQLDRELWPIGFLMQLQCVERHVKRERERERERAQVPFAQSICASY